MLLAGIIISMTFFFLFLFFIPSKCFQNFGLILHSNLDIETSYSDAQVHELLHRLWPIYRVFFIICTGFAYTGLCISFFRKYRVNYVYIFGIHPSNQMNEYQFYKIALFLLATMLFAALVEVLNVKGYVMFGDEDGPAVSWPTLIYALFLVIMLINPCDMAYKPFRYQFLQALWNTVVAPFAPVRFKDFFFGDILTSATKPFVDLVFIAHYFNLQDPHPAYRNIEISEHACRPSAFAVLIVSYLPFHFRFWQCIYKYNESGLWFPNLVNAGKYFAGIMVVLFSFVLS